MLNFKELYKIQPALDWNVYQLKYFAPEIFLFSSLLLFLVYGSLRFRNTKSFHSTEITAKSLVVILILSILLLINSLEADFTKIVFHGALFIENFSTILKIFVSFLTITLICASFNYSKRNNFEEYEYVLFLGFATGSIFILFSVFDFMSLLIAVEMLSFGLYILATVKKHSSLAAEASMKYLIMGLLSTGICAYGLTLVYWKLKSTGFLALQWVLLAEKSYTGSFSTTFIEEYSELIMGLTLILTLLLFKIAVVPFHAWAPDVYEGVPLVVTAYYTIVVKFAMLITFIKIVNMILKDIFFILQPGLEFMAIASLLIGSVMAVSQNRVKRLFVYSSISHVGYILIAVLANSEEGLVAAVAYTFIYTITNLALFTFLLNSDCTLEKSNVTHRVVELADLAKVGKASPFLALMFATSLLSFAGIPPFAGFFAKLKIFSVALDSGLEHLVAIALISSAISCFYYLKLIKATFFISIYQRFILLDDQPTTKSIMLWLILFLTTFIFFSGIFNAFLLKAIISYFAFF